MNVMPGGRPSVIEIARTVALVSTASGGWYAHNHTRDDIMELRNLVETIRERRGVAAHYGVTSGFELTYAIIDDIRDRHGFNFGWHMTDVDGDHGTIVLMDELDDICCESRLWLVSGDLKPGTACDDGLVRRPPPLGIERQRALGFMRLLIHAHNERVGSPYRIHTHTDFGHPPPHPIRADLVDDPLDGKHWVFRDRSDCALMHCRALRPRGSWCTETEQLVNYLIELAGTLIEQGPPPDSF